MKKNKVFITFLIMSMVFGNTVFGQDSNAMMCIDTNASSCYNEKLAEELFLTSNFDSLNYVDGLYQFTFTTTHMTDEMKSLAVSKAGTTLSKAGTALNPDSVNSKTTLVLATTEQNQAEALMNRLISEDSIDKKIWDATYSIKGILTVYFVEGRFPTGQDSLLITGVDGSVIRDDTSVSIVYDDNNYVKIGCNDGHTSTWGQAYTYPVTTIPFEERTPTSWNPMDVSQQIVGGAGASWRLPLRRANTYWDLVIENVLYGVINVY